MCYFLYIDYMPVSMFYILRTVLCLGDNIVGIEYLTRIQKNQSDQQEDFLIAIIGGRLYCFQLFSVFNSDAFSDNLLYTH